MPNHWTRKCSPGFFRYFHGARNEKFVVWDHDRKRPTSNPPSQELWRGRRPTSNIKL
jgi:hypothetical protein